MSNKFKVGDRVRFIKNGYTNVRHGEIGTVCDADYFGYVGVKWNRPNPDRHTCEGNCTNFYGWYVAPEWIGLLNDIDDCQVNLQVLNLEGLFV